MKGAMVKWDAIKKKAPESSTLLSGADYFYCSIW